MDVEFKKLCTPARIYFAFSIVSCLLCRKGYKSISWFLVLLPFIMIFLAYFGILRHMRQVDKLNPLVN